MTRKIKNWTDGDSGIFANGKGFRLANVRAQEKNKAGGLKALKTVAGMTARSSNLVNVKVVAKDRYGRVVVEMSNKDGSINERMRKKGYTNKGR